MAKRTLFILILFGSSGFLFAQEQKSGEVSYVTSNSVYVRFESTDGIAVGDTLFMEGQPCLTVLRTSSVSVVTESISDCDVQVGSTVSAIAESTSQEEVEDEQPPIVQEPLEGTRDLPQDSTASDAQEGRFTEVGGRVSLASYNVYSQDGYIQGYSRNVARLSLDAENLFTPGLSFHTYGNYQTFIPLGNQPESRYPQAGRLNVYNGYLQYRYQSKENSDRWLEAKAGRFINNRAASIGPVDGATFEVQNKNWFVGAIAGFRPDFQTFGTNPDLLTVGGYGGAELISGRWQHSGTIGFMEQMNQGETDRRYIYLQHSSSYGGVLNFFASSEVDIYENFDTAQAQSTWKWSSIYLSANYRISRKLSLFASYDSRQQIIFFEQYDSQVEQLLDQNGIQQGYRARLNYNATPHWNFSVGYHQRLNTNSDAFGRNVQVYIAYRNLPWVGGSLSLRTHLNTSRYLQSEVASARYSRSIFNNKIDFNLYSRYLNYSYLVRERPVSASWYYGTEWSFSLGNSWTCGILAEYSMQKDQDIIRGNLRLIKRF